MSVSSSRRGKPKYGTRSLKIPARRLHLERLESRLLLSTINWENRGQASDGFEEVFGLDAFAARSAIDTVNPADVLVTNLDKDSVVWMADADGFWDDAVNWSSGSVPGPNDDVIVDRADSDVTITHRSGETVVNSLTSTEKIVLSGGSLTATGEVQISDTLTLQGGMLHDTTVYATAGSRLMATSTESTLQGVTLNGDLDLNARSAFVTVLDGLTLNGTISLGGDYCRLEAAGTQTFDGAGTVVFGNAGFSTLRLPEAGTTLTLGPQFTVRGGSNRIASARLGYSDYRHGPSDVSVVNQGTIVADVPGTAIVAMGQSFTNEGTVGATGGGHLNLTNLAGDLGTVTPLIGSTLSLNGAYFINEDLDVGAGATLNLAGDWRNTSVITSEDATVNLGSSFTLADLGTFHRTGGTVNLTGTLENSGTTLELDAAAGSWQLEGGKIQGGTVSTSGGSKLVATSTQSTLQGVTLIGDLDLDARSAYVTVLDGLTLSGTISLGGEYCRLEAAGTQTFDGAGTVVFRNAGFSTLRLPQAGTTLTLGPEFTVRGGSNRLAGARLGYSEYRGGPSDVSVVNQGTIIADVPGTAIVAKGQGFTNEGALKAANGGNLNIDPPLAINGTGVLAGLDPGTIFGTISIGGNLTGNTLDAAQYAPLGTVRLDGVGTPETPQLMEVMSEDRGAGGMGFEGNFAYGRLALANNTYVKLVDDSDNAPGMGAEALYVDWLTVPAGTTLDISGLQVYVRAADISGEVTGGAISPVPDGGALLLGRPTPGTIAVAGEMDEWTFFGEAGSLFDVTIYPGSSGQWASLPPYLGNVEVFLLGSDGNVVAVASGSSGDIVTPANAVLPADDTYRIQVRASEGHEDSTGNYTIVAGDVGADLGDAPDSTNSYGTAMTTYGSVTANFPTVYSGSAPLNYGPIHLQAKQGAYLGGGVTSESEADNGSDEDATNNILPSGGTADHDGADDGLLYPDQLVLTHGLPNTFDFAVTWATSARDPFYLNVWFDFNRDGDWDDTLHLSDGTAVPEFAVASQPINPGPGTQLYTSRDFLAWHPDSGEGLVPLWMRMTLSEQPWEVLASLGSAGGSGPSTGYQYGETEDYYITDYAQAEMDFGDAPEGLMPGMEYPTTLETGGARHAIVGDMHLGGSVDAEPDGQPDLLAEGDDFDLLFPPANDDEDGVEFLTPLYVGQEAEVKVSPNMVGKLDAWIDFNLDGDWDPVSERIFSSLSIAPGEPPLTFTVPTDAAAGPSYARFRFSSGGGLLPSGGATNGEVEDYAIDILPSSEIHGRKWGDWDGDGGWDPGEPPLQGWTIFIDANNNGVLDGDEPFDVTDANGAYSFETLPPGIYTVAEVLEPRWEQTYPMLGSQLERVSQPDGIQVDNLSQAPSISADGRYVAFESYATNLVEGDTNNAGDVFVYDRQTGAIQRVSQLGQTQANAGSYYPLISADGRYVAFSSDATNLVDGDTNDARDAFIYDRQTGSIDRVSPSDGVQANGDSYAASISADGRYVAFVSLATNLVEGDTNGVVDVFVYDCVTGNVQCASRSDGMQADYGGGDPSISADGRYVAFVSAATNLVEGGTNGMAHVYVYDRVTWNNRRVTQAGQTQANAYSYYPSISADGKYVAFASYATNLVAGDTNDRQDVFVYDCQTGDFQRVSQVGQTQANDDSIYASISADGRFVAFESRATNLVDGDTNGWVDVFVYDRDTGNIQRASQADAMQTNHLSNGTSISANGRYVTFASSATTLVQPDANGLHNDVFVNSVSGAPPAGSHWVYVGLGVVRDDVDFGNRHLMDYGDAPQPYPVLLSDDGARHRYDPDVLLGTMIDHEPDGQPDAAAQGDDLDLLYPPAGNNDEDGVVFLEPLLQGQLVPIEVTASMDGLLSAWIDFNGDGDWADPDDEVFVGVPLSGGVTPLSFTVPEEGVSQTGKTFARFRFSTTRIPSFMGEAPDGEVEDYQVEIFPLSKISGRKWDDQDGNGQWDAGEPPLAGWTVFLDTDGNGTLDPGEPTRTTGTDGSYLFDDLLPGKYVVGEVQQPWWEQTYPLVVAEPEFSVNTYTAGNLSTPAVAMDDPGDFVVVWASDGQDASGYGIYGQRYAADGREIGTEFPINTHETGNQQDPAVAMDSDGDFTVTWTSYGQDGDGAGVYAQRYSNAGNRVGGEIPVNTYTADMQLESAVAMDPNGNSVVVWAGAGQGSDGWDIYGRRFDANGYPRDQQEFRVNTQIAGTQLFPSVAMDALGNFVVVWCGDGPSGEGIYAQRFHENGSPWGPQELVSVIEGLSPSPISPNESVGMAPAGDFVVAWCDMIGGDVHGRRYDTRWDYFQPAFRANTYLPDAQWYPSLAMDPQGDFVITWESVHQDGDGWGVYAQKYTADGRPSGDEFRVNDTTAGHQMLPSVAMNAHGNFVIVWNDASVGFADVDARLFRLGSHSLVLAPGGKAEDVDFGNRRQRDYGDADEDGTSFPTTEDRDGARHSIDPDVYLGPDAMVRVSQESDPLADDFDENVLGYIQPYVTDLSIADYYEYDTVYASSFNGSEPLLDWTYPLGTTSSQLFFVYSTVDEELAMFVVHDKPQDGDGGSADMAWQLAGDTAGYLVLDDPSDVDPSDSYPSNGPTSFQSLQSWDALDTDGMVIGTLEGDWTMTGGFTSVPTGIDSWWARSLTFNKLNRSASWGGWDSMIELALDPNRRVRLEYLNGGGIDAERDAQLEYALWGGDDLADIDDENGVQFINVPTFGHDAEIIVTASQNGWLQGWADFNGNGSWADSGEQIFVNQWLEAGTNRLSFSMPGGMPWTSVQTRFRFSTQANLPYDGPASDGEVEDYEVLPGEYDFGDADGALFPTLLQHDGARHSLGSSFLGTNVDAEPNGQPNSTATGDGADDDGVVFTSLLIPDQTATVDVTVTSGSPSADNYLSAWVDFDGNGSWSDQGEEIFVGQVLANSTSVQTHSLSFPVPADAAAGTDVFARFRLAPYPVSYPWGRFGGGEVEDYLVHIEPPRDFGDAPGRYPTAYPDGARHALGGPWLGGADDQPDDEPDAQVDLHAMGDDHDGNDDEDGVVIPPLIIGMSNQITVEVSGRVAYLDAWIDFNGDDTWSGGEQIHSGQLGPGEHQITVVPPAGTLPGTTFARFRVSSQGGLPPVGPADDGEVEDYEVGLFTPSEIHGQKFNDLNGNGVRDAGESPLQDWTFFLDTDHDGVWDDGEPSAVTDEYGNYAFEPLLPGTYKVTEVLQDGWLPTGPSQTGQVFPVNHTTSGIQHSPSVAMDAHGNSVVVWSSENANGDDDVVFRRYDAAGAALDQVDKRVNVTDPDFEVYADVAMNAAGDFVVVWISQTIVDTMTVQIAVYARVYDSDGEPQTDEKLVDSKTHDDTLAPAATVPAVAMDDDGNFVVVWQRRMGIGSETTNPFDVYAGRYSAAGNPLPLSANPVNTTTVGSQEFPDVAMAPDGRFVIVWKSEGQDPDGSDGIYAQWYDANGSTQGGEVHVNSTIDLNQSFPSVAMDSGGNCIVVWESEVELYPGAHRVDLFGQRFYANRNMDRPEFPIYNSVLGVELSGSSVATTASHQDFVVAWQTSINEDSRIRARLYAEGVAQGTEFQVYVPANGRVSAPAAAMDADGDFVVVWQDSQQDPDDSPGISARQYSGHFHQPYRDVRLAPGETLTGIDLYNHQLRDFGDAPDDYPVMLSQDGARHIIMSGGPVMGTPPDNDLDGQPDFQALGDDNYDGNDDEDGVSFGQWLLQGDPAARVDVDMRNSPPGEIVLNAWIDFTGDGDWDDADEQIFLNEPLTPGVVNSLTFFIPASATLDETFARFRVSSVPDLSFVGEAPDGEVEDYAVKITPPGEIHGRKWEDWDRSGEWDEGEPPLSGWTIFADLNGDGILDAGEPFDVTNASGEYSLELLPPGTYQVAEVLRVGWRQTFPATGWALTDTVSFVKPTAVAYNTHDERLYVGRGDGSSDGLYRIEPDGGIVPLAAGGPVSGVVVDPEDGDIFVSEHYGGDIFRVPFGQTGRTPWVTGFENGNMDDDPIGMAITPNGYRGSVLDFGDALVVDRGYAGTPEAVWRFSPDDPEGEVLLHADNGTLINPVDVTIGATDIYLVDTGEENGGSTPGGIFRLGTGGALTLVPTSEPLLDPVGIVTDPVHGDLLVVDGIPGRVVRIDPETGEVVELVTGLTGPLWAGIDVTPNGSRIFVSDYAADRICTYDRMGAHEVTLGEGQVVTDVNFGNGRELEIAARHVFYNDSAFDGNDPAAGVADDGAIATDKEALLPGDTASPANYTSYAKGINGLMIDVAGLPGNPTAADFEFLVGNDNDPANWEPLTTPFDIAVHPGEGDYNSDRITLTWPDNTIQNTWLQVTVLATVNTGLAEPDVFYFGNAIGETGNATTDARVNAIDALLARSNPRTLTDPAPIDFPYDFNRDQRVNATDMLIARNNQTHSLNALKLITVPNTGDKASVTSAARLETLPNRGARPTCDTIWEQAAVEESTDTSAKVDWLFDVEDPQPQQRPEDHEETVDELLLTWAAE